jgi:hypothetical protein
VACIAAALFTCILGVAQPAPLQPVIVRIDLRTDPSVVSGAVGKGAFDEARTIWRAHGVLLTRASDSGLPCANVEATIVSNSGGGRIRRIDGTRVLGTTEIAGAASGPSRVRLSFDDIASNVASEPLEWASMHDHTVSRAIGRVLAHEVGHVLLGPDHDRDGLMRQAFDGSDLARPDRLRFLLSEASIARMTTGAACWGRLRTGGR